ncbi:MAG TPA: hypothetical protein VGM25_00965 [Caulobacteraceae bacterium]|jgi:hypothetical protein
MKTPVVGLGLALALLAAGHALAQSQPGPVNRPPLVFHEGFSDGFSEDPITQKSIETKGLRFATYGPGKDMWSKTWHPKAPAQGGFMWTGACTQVCGFTLYLPNEDLDLRGLAKVTWRTAVTGLHHLRLLIKTADGKLLVSDQSVEATSDWHVSDLIIADLRWREVDTKNMNDINPPGNAAWLPQPDLSKVAEIGFTDLQPGSGHGVQAGSSRVDWIEVYGVRVPRK